MMKQMNAFFAFHISNKVSLETKGFNTHLNRNNRSVCD